MYVRLISFGTNWWAARDIARSGCQPAWFNSTGFRCGRRLHVCAFFHGQVRFNLHSGFHPAFPARVEGRTFCCDGPHLYNGRTHLLVKSPAPKSEPDACLVTVTDCPFGQIFFEDPCWRSATVQLISISRRNGCYEAMFLMGPNDWLRTSLGVWRLSPDKRRLVLGDPVSGAAT
jgi:hypothetical protein